MIFIEIQFFLLLLLSQRKVPESRVTRSAKDIARFAKKVQIENEKEQRVVRLFQKDGKYTDYLSMNKLKKGISKELEKEPIDLNEVLKKVEAEGFGNAQPEKPEDMKYVITIGDIDSEFVKPGI